MPSPTPATLLSHMPLLHQCAEMMLERVAVAAGQPDRRSHGDPAMLARESWGGLAEIRFPVSKGITCCNSTPATAPREEKARVAVCGNLA